MIVDGGREDRREKSQKHWADQIFEQIKIPVSVEFHQAIEWNWWRHIVEKVCASYDSQCWGNDFRGKVKSLLKDYKVLYKVTYTT